MRIRGKRKKVRPTRSVAEMIEWYDNNDTGDYLAKMPEVEFDIDIKRTLKTFLTRLTRGQNLSRDEAAHFLDALLDSEATDGQIAAALIALKLKRGTVEDLAGSAHGMRQRALRISPTHTCVIDRAGAGASRSQVCNASAAPPDGVPRPIIGVWGRDLSEPLAQTLALLGTERAWIVHGADGLDEVTISNSTFIAEAIQGQVRTFEIGPDDFGLGRSELDHLRGGDAEGNAVIIREVVSGARQDEARALVVVNAAAALHVGGFAESLRDAARIAASSIDTGAALAKLDQLIEATN